MLTYMTQKKHDPKLGKKQINFRLRNLHRIGLEMASRQHGTDLTEEIHTAIRLYLEAKGMWDAALEDTGDDEGE
ncbi:MAG: hypothetical protein E6Q97_04385 [Desulfurellales bacterium]|nr:MAG: hypothetical protein E6Q97_04385 [Desulfurellales bacterium]